MNRPQALIEGDLAFPKPRPFDGLPPPFGSRRRAARVAAQNAAQPEPQPAAQTVAQQAIQDAVQRKEQPARQSPFPPGVRHVLFYKAPPQRSDAHRFDAEMAEAKRYLEMGKARPRSSRSDYVIGATIFLGCSIALAWLLATCTTRDAEKATTLAVTRQVVPAVSSAPVDHPQEPAKVAQLAVEDAQTVAQNAPSVASAVSTASAPSSVAAVTAPASSATSYAAAEVAPARSEAAAEVAPARSEASHTAAVVALAPSKPSYAVPTVASASQSKNDDTTPKVGRQSERTQLSQHTMQQPTARASTREGTTSRPAKADRKVAVARMTEAHVDERLALSRTVRPATQPSVSKQPEWTARPSAENDAIDQAALLNWAAQQRAHVTTRATVPVPGDTDWNARMTQRRITDNPDAFQAGRGQK
ncbi:hypothetical protein HHL24_24705 [Paraburkholderia sp. RP-4-7]|uniref:Uncharacterized protein n=1 Tax=Paraburkholderia polaris TaxID=2728848 RepID=A0A848III2_9BURK|nr:hypothetical protein [Paraburkholderia polaris]NMM01130.1 hypothetical protein [Paraburkholderia polaris]